MKKYVYMLIIAGVISGCSSTELGKPLPLTSNSAAQQQALAAESLESLDSE